MRCLIKLLPFLLTTPLYAGEIYRWYPSTTNFPEGECYRTQEANSANGYVEKVKTEDCRPEKTSYLWTKGRCFEVDSATQGQAFGKSAENAKCAPENALYAFDPVKKECWLVDPKNPNGYKARLNASDCKPPEEQLVRKFVPNANGVGGDCIEVHRTEGETRWNRRLDTAQCRTDVTKYLWRRTGELKGECWEVAGDGPQYYSNKVSNSYCKPSEVIYRFERTGEKRGDCYEMDKETGGNNWLVKVTTSECREEN